MNDNNNNNERKTKMKNQNQIKTLTPAQIRAAAATTAESPQRTSNDVLALNNMPRREQQAYRQVLRGSLTHCILHPADRAIDERHLTILDAILG